MNIKIAPTSVTFDVEGGRSVTLNYHGLSAILLKLGQSLKAEVATTQRALLTCSSLVRLIDARAFPEKPCK